MDVRETANAVDTQRLADYVLTWLRKGTGALMSINTMQLVGH